MKEKKFSIICQTVWIDGDISTCVVQSGLTLKKAAKYLYKIQKERVVAGRGLVSYGKLPENNFIDTVSIHEDFR